MLLVIAADAMLCSIVAWAPGTAIFSGPEVRAPSCSTSAPGRRWPTAPLKRRGELAPTEAAPRTRAWAALGLDAATGEIVVSGAQRQHEEGEGGVGAGGGGGAGLPLALPAAAAS